MADEPFTVRQKKYFAAMRASLERDTGKSLAEWVAIARTCPETAPHARLTWFKQEHGLLQNRASLVLAEALEGGRRAWDDPDALVRAVWSEPGPRGIYKALDRLATALPGTVRTPRKTYTAWGREFQFAAARPLRHGGALLGLALDPAADLRLAPARNEAWSERLKSRLEIGSSSEVDATIVSLLRRAWEAS
ncbi:MAG TPA: DUF5655 domain-containing protein [Caulobacteraceae bacterium]|nr:DUF5655 domain-containing protein [Caulobacteraceae bacterium]